MCGAECWTDHRLVVSKLRLQFHSPRRPQGKKAAKRTDVSKLTLQENQELLAANLSEKLDNIQLGHADVNQDWSVLRDAVHSVTLETLGTSEKKHQDWFDDNDSEIQDLLQEKHRLFVAHQQDQASVSKKAAFTKARQTVQTKLRNMQDTWLSNKAVEIQGYADRHDTKRFYDALRTVYGPQSSGSSPLLSADGSTLITEKEKILERWAEHFNSVLNRPSSINDEAIQRLPQVEINSSLDKTPTITEVNKAIKQLSCGKAPGSDAIPAEIYKCGGDSLSSKLLDIFTSCWDKETLPQEFKDASIVHLYKRKGNKQTCDNHRGISLLCIAGKILARVLLNRLIEHLENGHLPESQCGFRSGRGTVDMVFAARQLQEKCQEQYQDLYTAYVDLTKAFDTVSRNGLWKIMSKFGCPERFIAIVRQFHEGMMARVLDNGDQSPEFQVSNGVKQGCVLAPTLFSLMFSAMLSEALGPDEPGIGLRYRTDGKLFNQRRLNAVTKVKSTIIRDFLFADDCALNASTEANLQRNMDQFSSACDSFGLTISTKKTEILHQPAPGKPYTKPSIQVKGCTLQDVDKFTYLGSTLARTATIDDEVTSRIAKASSAYGRLRSNVWERRGIRIDTKLAVYRAVVLTTLLYASETWTVYARHARQLNHFHTSCLRKLLGIRWQDKIPDSEVLGRAKLPSVHMLLQQSQMRWTGHVCRMSDNRLPKQLLYGELSAGKRKVGGQKKRYKDNMKASLRKMGLHTDTWEDVAPNRPAWRAAVNKGLVVAETSRLEHAWKKRMDRKARAASTSTTPTDHVCDTCGRTFQARIGLISHQRTHRRQSTA